jgi:membrane fusion protein, heavy metal efflux system
VDAVFLMKSRNKLGIVLFACLFGCHGSDLNGKHESPLLPGELRLSPDLTRSGQIQIERVQATVEAVTLRTSGKATFNQERLSYVSSPLVGRVTEIRARPGQRVEAGQVLAVIDSAELGTASSEFIKARADLVLAQRNRELAQQLWDAKAMAHKDLQKADDELLKAKTDVRRARERLVSLDLPPAELDRPLDALHVQSRFILSAPIAGTVVESTLTLGQMVGGDPAQRLYVLADLTELWVTADVYEKDLPAIRPGEDVSVQAAAWPQEPFRGHIDYVGDTVDAVSRTVKVRLMVDNRRLLLKPEMFVTATIRADGSSTALTVPPAAVHGEGSEQPYVFTALGDNRFARRSVTLGARTRDRITIAAGLSPHDDVVTEGSILLKAEADRQANG